MVKVDNVETLSLSKVDADVNQPRQAFDKTDLDRLADSIKRQGILVPLAVEKTAGGRYLILDGERRYRAAKQVNLKEVPAIVYEAMSETERLAKRFHLQEQHSAWNAFDKARAITQLQASSGLSNQEIAEMLGLSLNTVQDYVLLLRFSKRTIEFAASKRIPYSRLSDFAPVLKQFEKSKQREAIEEAFVKKVEMGVIRTTNDVRKISIAFRADAENGKVAEKFVSDDDITPSEIAAMAKQTDFLVLEKVRYQTHRLVTVIREATKHKAWRGADSKEFNLLQEADKEIEKALRLIGHTD
jgi:ParB family chromosome partitioning protein